MGARTDSIFVLEDSNTFDEDDRSGGVSRVEKMCVFVVRLVLSNLHNSLRVGKRN